MPIPVGTLTAAGATAADMIEITKSRYLLGGASEQRNRLSADYTAGSSTLAFAYPLRGIQAGSTLSIGLNAFYVWDVDNATNTATVDGGQRGSTDTAAYADDTVTVNPQYSNFDIFNALNEEIASLSSPATGLFQMKQTELAYNAARIGYDLPGVTNLTSIYEVRYTEPDGFLRTPVLDRDMWRLERNNLTSEASSTLSLKILHGLYQGQTVTVMYKTTFSVFTDFSDDVAQTGIPTSAMDIPPMGAAIRLGVGREIRRNDPTTQGDTRRAAEVGPGAAAASYRGLTALYLQRIAQESARLSALYPNRL